MKEARRVFITDCEGPVSKNDNAFELTRQFVPEGEKFFTQISRYDDVLADIVKRDGYKAGDTLKLIVPFLKAHGVTNNKMREFSIQNIFLMPGAKEALQFIRGEMPSFIVSTSYEHYLSALCEALSFPYENTYCTPLNIDAYYMSDEERERLEGFKLEMNAMPLIEIPEAAESLLDLSEKSRQAVERLDEIFWREIMQGESGAMLRAVNPVGGVEKAEAAKKIVDAAGSRLSNLVYVGDSITDVECLRLVREEGGVTVSFNGNAYAVREAEIAVLSMNAIVVAVIAYVFNRLGKESLYSLVDNWGYTSLKDCVNSLLLERLRGTFTEGLPKVARITEENAKKLASESSAFRKLVRGEQVGGLG